MDFTNSLPLPTAGNAIACLVLALSIGSVSFTITRTRVAEPFRNWVRSKSEWLGNLFSRPYCLGHWLSFGATLIYRPVIIQLWWPLDLLVTAFVIITLAVIFSGAIARALSEV